MTLENGERFEGDLLVGADGIRSKVRINLFGPTEAIYSGYTCYTGIADFVPADIETVGYVCLCYFNKRLTYPYLLKSAYSYQLF